MNIAVVLLGLLLVTLSYSENKSIKDKFSYYIYNTSVEINAYYCSYSMENDFQCEHSDSGKIQTNSSYFVKKCKSNFFVEISNLIYKHRIAKLCEIPARVNLLEDIVTLSDNKSCLYSGKTCYDENNSKIVFWNDICKNIIAIHWNTFTSFICKYDQTMFIRDAYISLILKEKLQFCDVEVWKTNHDNIFVSPKLFSTIVEKKAELSKLQSNSLEFCNGKTNNQQSSTDSRNVNDVTKIWYVYKYPIDVTIHVCLMNEKKSCEHLNLGETLSKNNLNLLNQCRNNFCDSSPCKYNNSRIVLCRRTLQVDLEKNSIRELLSECKYSEGLCKTMNTFWQYTDRCNSIKLAYKGYERMCGHRKCVIQDNSTELILSQQGLLCGETVWYTVKNGLVASEREFESFSLENTVLPSENLSSSQLHPVLKSVKIEEYFIISFLTVCLLWIGFKIVMSLIYLCTKCTTKKKIPAASEGVELRRVRTEVLPQN